MCQAIPFFFSQTPVLWPFQMDSSIAAPIQMPICMFSRKMILILLEPLQQLKSIFVNKRSTLEIYRNRNQRLVSLINKKRQKTNQQHLR